MLKFLMCRLILIERAIEKKGQSTIHQNFKKKVSNSNNYERCTTNIIKGITNIKLAKIATSFIPKKE